jgi:hypothetical protein
VYRSAGHARRVEGRTGLDCTYIQYNILQCEQDLRADMPRYLRRNANINQTVPRQTRAGGVDRILVLYVVWVAARARALLQSVAGEGSSP